MTGSTIREVRYWWCIKCKQQFSTKKKAHEHRCPYDHSIVYSGKTDGEIVFLKEK